MKVKNTTLENGLRVVTAQLEDARSVTVNIVVATGSRFEDYDRNGGVSHFLEHLLFKGTKKYPSPQAIAEAVDAVGGYNNAYTGEDLTSYYIKVPARHIDLAIDILCEMVSQPLLDQAELDRERTVIVEEMNVFRDDPPRFIGTLVPSLLYPNNPLGRDVLGPESVIESISRDDIMAYLRSHYRPNNIVVALAGAVDHQAAVDRIQQNLGVMEQADVPAFTPVSADISSEMTVAFQKDTAQAHFMLAARAYSYEDADEPAARVAAAVLGRGMSSRLFLNVRERQGLAYNIFAETNSYVDTGMFAVYAGVTTDKINQAVTSVMNELERIAHEPVGAAELAKAKLQLTAGLEMSLESNSNVADRIGAHMALLGRVRSVDEAIAEVEAVTAEDVLRVAQTMLKPAALRFVVIAPEPEAAARHFESLVTVKEK